ncbi:hypothetical protein [Gramella sp. MAR_2010_147]|uniref:hypothetical protein n=1 Tax=Gramella sp. MAR_2010_147 TaxID=1250205 RepID=UPI00087D020F|nr:hypothetical protein [Gramella sp. MAR_2010_147]SDR83256.1 hypothetical protein SAMN04488553_0811 [Gramella sp. MAR_2010_147]
MANILDIFRTYAGERLLEQSCSLTSLEKEKLQKVFVQSLPALLSLYMTNGVPDNSRPNNLIEFIENGDLIEFGERELNLLLDKKEQKVFLDLFVLIDLNLETFKKVIYISTAILTLIISEIRDKNEVEISNILKTLAGIETIYDENFVKVLIKNQDDPNFIDNSEEITLGRKDGSGDKSILGGYTGGR